jgi:Na+/H+ antiporter NhaC
VTHGILSIVPPVLALVLAIATRNVILSLGVGVFLGMTIAAGFDPLAGLLDFFELGVMAQLADAANSQVVILIVVIGGFVHLLDRSGGMASFARQMTRYVDTPAKAQLSVWLTGLGIFFTDSGNPLILGPLFRPIFTGLRISREKLAFIIDSTSSPVCVLIPVISWGVYIMSLLEQSFDDLAITTPPLHAHLKTLPYQLYPLAALVTVPLMAALGREWGPMARAQARAEAQVLDTVGEAGENDTPQASGRAILIPLATVFVVLTALFAGFWIQLGSLPGAKVRLALLIAYLAGTVVCGALLSREGIMTAQQTFRTFLRGMGQMVFIVLILLLAWSLGDVCELLDTGSFVARIFDHGLPTGLLPAMVFALGAVFSLSTGSSWGTFALLMPIAIPVAHEAGAPLFVTIAAVLSGGIFGDHCSPVSDTTILSSMATGCAHADHVNTQLAYALVTGGSALAGFVVAGLTGAVWTIAVVLALQVVLTVAFARALGTPLKGR